MGKTLRKAIMIRPRPNNRFNKIRSAENWSLYRHKETLLQLFKENTNRLFPKKNQKLVSNNKIFLKTVEPSFSDKSNFSNKIIISGKTLHSF